MFPAIRGTLVAESEDAKKVKIAELEKRLVLFEGEFRKSSNGKAFFGGDNIGYLDIAIGSFLVSLEAIERFSGIKLLNESKTPCLIQWADRFSSHAAVKDVLPDADKLSVAMKLRAKMLKAMSYSK